MLRSVLIVLASAATTVAQGPPTPPVLVNSASSTAVPRYSVQAAASSVVPGRVFVAYGRHGTQSDSALAFSSNSGDSFGTETVLSGSNCLGATLGRIAQPSIVGSRTEGQFWLQALAANPGSAVPWRSSVWQIRIPQNNIPIVSANRMAYCDGGWSVLTFNPFGRAVPGEARKIHVANAPLGNNANPGTQAQPVETLQHAYGMITDGHGDWILLRRGDTWDRNVDPWWPAWNNSGRSAAEPIVVGAYDDGTAGPNPPRPILECRSSSGIQCLQGLRHVAILDLDLRGSSNGTSYGIYLLGNSEDLLIEGCVARHFLVSYVVQGDLVSDIRLRRNVSLAPYAPDPGPHAQGTYLEGIDGLLIEDCVFDWGEDNPAPATIFRHNVYIQSDCKNVIARNNINARGLDAWQQRVGGLHERNLHLSNGINQQMGALPFKTSVVRHNAYIGAMDFPSPHEPRGTGLVIEGPADSDYDVYDNIFSGADDTITSANYNIAAIVTQSDDGSALVRDNIVWKWANPGGMGAALELRPGEAPGPTLTFRSNDLQQPVAGWVIDDTVGKQHVYQTNRYHSPFTHPFRIGPTPKQFSEWQAIHVDYTSVMQDLSQVYSSPDRTVGTYMDFIGLGGGLGAFVDRAVEQRRGDWDHRFAAEAVIDYVRAGFNRAPVGIEEFRGPGFLAVGPDAASPTEQTLYHIWNNPDDAKHAYVRQADPLPAPGAGQAPTWDDPGRPATLVANQNELPDDAAGVSGVVLDPSGQLVIAYERGGEGQLPTAWWSSTNGRPAPGVNGWSRSTSGSQIVLFSRDSSNHDIEAFNPAWVPGYTDGSVFRPHNWPGVAADRDRPDDPILQNGWVYVAFCGHATGDPYANNIDLYIARSENGGRTFTPGNTLRVTDHMLGVIDGYPQVRPSIGIDECGGVIVFYYQYLYTNHVVPGEHYYEPRFLRIPSFPSTNDLETASLGPEFFILDNESMGEYARMAVAEPNGYSVYIPHTGKDANGAWNVYLNRYRPPCTPPADVDLNDVVDGNDAALFSSWFAGGDHRADINRDGVLNAADTTMFFASYACGCRP